MIEKVLGSALARRMAIKGAFGLTAALFGASKVTPSEISEGVRAARSIPLNDFDDGESNWERCLRYDQAFRGIVEQRDDWERKTSAVNKVRAGLVDPDLMSMKSWSPSFIAMKQAERIQFEMKTLSSFEDASSSMFRAVKKFLGLKGY